MPETPRITREIAAQEKHREDNPAPRDFGTLKVPCPKCGAKIRENYRKFQCQKCRFSLWTIMAGRQINIAEAEELIAKRRVGPLQGFRSKTGRTFAAVIRLTSELKPEFDFAQDKAEADSAVAEVDFTGQEPLGKCPQCGSRVFESATHYVCEKAMGAARTCSFRSGKIILQQPVERAQIQKLLRTGKTDLLRRFISKKGRPFKAFLVVKKGDVGFEFESRAGSAKGRTAKTKAPEPPAPKIDFTGQKAVGKCPKCRKRVFEAEDAYICEQSQSDKHPCPFKINKAILQQPIDRAQAARLLKDRMTDLLPKFISLKTGRPFSAYLMMDEAGKVSFEFPERGAVVGQSYDD